MRSPVLFTACAVMLLSACSFDFPVEGEIGFGCSSDAECVSGYVCRGLADGSGAVGRCAPDDAVGSLCVDEDNDGAFVGPDCTEQILDCDDTVAAIRPGVDEVCDGIDNNCTCDRTTGDTNGDGVACGPGDDGVDEDVVSRPCPLQSGSCSGAVSACVDGAYQDCVTDGLYDARIQDATGRDDLRFESTEATCDGFDNDCDGSIDENCECVPGVSPAEECNVDSGPCTRGISLCRGNGTRSGCVEARVGTVCEDGSPCAADADCGGGACGVQTCESDADCGESGYCIDEEIAAAESLTDDCGGDGELSCFRQVCRYLDGDEECDSDDDCGEGALCLAGACQPNVILPLASDPCNGLDDNCNGAIDDPFDSECGVCPFNSQLVDIFANNRSDFVCVDQYEASRPDATDTDPGSLELYVTSRANVLPWTGLTADEALEACRGEAFFEAVGGVGFRPIEPKRLCRTFEWRQGCGGKDRSSEEVPYPYSVPGEPALFLAGACVDASLDLDGPLPTGSQTQCCRDEICDAVGNVAEYVTGAGNLAQIAGGSFEDDMSSVLTCASSDGANYFDVPEDITNIGFRCCTQPSQ